MSKSLLSNCYTPVIAIPEASTPEERHASLLKSRTNGDGEPRAKEGLRRVCMETSLLSQKDGSCLVELGHTKVLCSVSLTTDGNLSQVDTGVLQVRVKFVPHFGIAPCATVSALDDGGGDRSNRQATMVQQVDLENSIRSALLPSFMRLSAYPKLVISVEISVLQNDGSLLTACILASTLGLADAQMELVDVVTCCEVVVLDNQYILADPTFAEEAAATTKVTMAMMPNWKELTLWQQSGSAPPETIALCRDGCKTLQKMVRQYLIDKC